MIPKTIPSAGSFKDNLVFNQLVRPMDPNVVFELSNKRAILGYFTRLLSQKGGQMSIPLATNVIESANIGLDWIQGTVQSRTASGSALVLTFDAPIDAARVGDKVFFNGRWDRGGRVAAAVNGVGGSVTIEPLYAGTMSFGGSDFPVGSKVMLYGDIRTNNVSSPKQRRFVNPEIEVNYMSTKREGIWNARYEKVSTRVSTNGQQQTVMEFNGQWYTAQQQQAIMRLEMAKEFDIVFSNRDIYTTSEGEFSTNGGIRWAAINRGGVYLPFASALTRDLIEDFFTKIHVQTLGSSSPFMFCAGLGLWRAISRIYEDQIRETGILNTFGGEDVRAYNIRTFAVPGVNRDIALIETPLFDDPQVNAAQTTIPEYAGLTTTQLTGLVFTDSMQSWNGQSLPQILRYHFGQNEYHVGRLKGMDSAGSGAFSASMADTAFASAMEGGDGSITDVATLADVTEISILTQSGIDLYGRGIGFIEPTI